MFEGDPQKSLANQKKHGISFEEAHALWKDPDHIEIQAKTVGEERYMVVGRIGQQHWSAIITYRRDKIRIISVRRSRNEERMLYEGN